ncbi:MAG: helix-turn-helix transcriptional regulator [Nanobdellota archaeon]
MNQKHIGIILLIASLLIGMFVFIVQQQSNAYADNFMQSEGTCFLEDGTCLHKRNLPLFIFGWSFSGALFLFGIYLTFIDKTQQFMSEHQIKVSSALENAMKKEKEKDEFNAYIAGFDEEEQKVIKAIKEREGIKQSTLRYRTNISKTALSLLIKKLEDKGVISRKPSGKTKQVYLIKKF